MDDRTGGGPKNIEGPVVLRRLIFLSQNVSLESMSYKSKSFEREKYHLKAIHFVVLINTFYCTLQFLVYF